MGAHVITDEHGKPIGFACFRGRGMKRCEYVNCDKAHTSLCDFPIGRKTCDMKLCDIHRIKQAKPDTDFCPRHSVEAENKVPK